MIEKQDWVEWWREECLRSFNKGTQIFRHAATAPPHEFHRSYVDVEKLNKKAIRVSRLASLDHQLQRRPELQIIARYLGSTATIEIPTGFAESSSPEQRTRVVLRVSSDRDKTSHDPP